MKYLSFTKEVQARHIAIRDRFQQLHYELNTSDDSAYLFTSAIEKQDHSDPYPQQWFDTRKAERAFLESADFIERDFGSVQKLMDGRISTGPIACAYEKIMAFTEGEVLLVPLSLPQPLVINLSYALPNPMGLCKELTACELIDALVIAYDFAFERYPLTILPNDLFTIYELDNSVLIYTSQHVNPRQ